MVKLVTCISNNITLKRSTTSRSCNFQSMKLEDVLTALNEICWLCAPQEFKVRRQNLLCKFAIDNLVYSCSITNVGKTNET